MTDDSFASRWSRRKQAVKDEAVEIAPEPEVEELPEEPEKSDAEVLEEFNLKDPDEMEAGDDFSAFMNSAIPERLRNRALRKLWLSIRCWRTLINLWIMVRISPIKGPRSRRL